MAAQRITQIQVLESLNIPVCSKLSLKYAGAVPIIMGREKI